MPRSSTQPPREPTLLDQPGLLDQPRPGSNMPEFSVGDISRLLKKTVEETFGLVRVRGEISECKYHSSGHVYITLKDESAMLAAVCWRGSVSKLSIRPEVGMEVVCTGRITTYPGQSKYQLVIDGMVLAGIGALLKMLEERKKKLEAEGLFAPDRKRKLPFLPEVIGVITSPTGAVIRDILHRLADRFPRHVLVWPVAVQGEGAAQQVAFAIDGFNLLVASGALPTPDVLIVARGGGSVEDLMAFNEEIVVRAVAASKIPIISAVGHETDTTLIDLAADVRAPTPTAAAEMAVPVRDEILERLLKDGTRLETALRRVVGERREHMSLLARALGDPARVFEPLMQRLDEKAERLTLAWTTFVDRRTSRVSEYVARIRHPRDILKLAAQHVEHAVHKIQSCWRASLDRGANRVNEAAAKIRHPRDTVRLSEQNLDHLAHKMQSGWRESLLRQQSRLATAGTVLEHLSPRAVLGRGYALVQDASGQVVMSRSQPKKGDPLRIEFNDGPRQVMVED